MVPGREKVVLAEIHKIAVNYHISISYSFYINV